MTDKKLVPKVSEGSPLCGSARTFSMVPSASFMGAQAPIAYSFFFLECSLPTHTSTMPFLSVFQSLLKTLASISFPAIFCLLLSLSPCFIMKFLSYSGFPSTAPAALEVSLESGIRWWAGGLIHHGNTRTSGLLGVIISGSPCPQTLPWFHLTPHPVLIHPK